MTDQHQHGAFYWGAGGEHCPHGTEPDRDSAAWDTWAERHTGSPQDVFICLDAPAGEACLECSDEHGDMVPWALCRVREHARPKHGVTPTPDMTHEPVTVWIGTYECLDRECEEYVTEDGDDDPGVERCSHIREELACSCQREGDGEYGSVPCLAATASA